MSGMRTEAESDASGLAARQSAADDAAGWQARLGAPDCTGLDRARFEEWRTNSRENARASDVAGRVDALLDDFGGSDPELLAMADEAFADSVSTAGAMDSSVAAGASSVTAHTAGKRLARWALPLAASVLIGSLLLVLIPSDVVLDHGSTAQYVASDARRDFTLADGSVVRLDVYSELNVRIANGRRELDLVRGRALFDVARDVKRPFTVSAGNTRVTALGTHFQVQRDSERVVVTLTEGSVAVADTTMPQWRETLSPGEAVSVSTEPGAHVKHPADVQVATSWSQGRHVFRATPLALAIQEVNHYAMKKVRLGDPQLASLIVGGNFVAGDSASVVAAFEAALPVRVVEGGGELILFRRYEAESH